MNSNSNPEDPDDTLQKLLSRKQFIENSYNVTDAVKLDEQNNRTTRNTAKPRQVVRGKKYWFDAR